MRCVAALIPRVIPGNPDAHAASVLQPRWGRARRRLLLGLLVLPLGFGLWCAAMVLVAAAGSGFGAWHGVALAGSLVPCLLVLLRFPAWAGKPATWPLKPFLVGGAQVAFGGIPATALTFGELSAGLGVLVIVLGVAALTGAFALTYAAARALFEPMCPELGDTPFTVSFRVRTAGSGAAGMVHVDADRIEWWGKRIGYLSRLAESATGSLPLRAVVATRLVNLPPGPSAHPWLVQRGGAPIEVTAGPAVVLTSANGEVLLPVTDPSICLALVNRRIQTARRPLPG